MSLQSAAGKASITIVEPQSGDMLWIMPEEKGANINLSIEFAVEGLTDKGCGLS